MMTQEITQQFEKMATDFGTTGKVLAQNFKTAVNNDLINQEHPDSMWKGAREKQIEVLKGQVDLSRYGMSDLSDDEIWNGIVAFVDSYRPF